MDDFSALLWPKPLGPSPEAEVGAAEGLEAEQEVGLKVERGDADGLEAQRLEAEHEAVNKEAPQVDQVVPG